MGHPYATHTGEPFALVTIQRDGVRCRWCRRVIRVREQAAFFARQPAHDRHECRECLYDAPLTNHNRWRKDHHEHDVAPTAPGGLFD